MDASLFEKLIGGGATPNMIASMATEEGRDRQEKFMEMLQMSGGIGNERPGETPEQRMGRMMKQAKQVSSGLGQM